MLFFLDSQLNRLIKNEPKYCIIKTFYKTRYWYNRWNYFQHGCMDKWRSGDFSLIKALIKRHVRSESLKLWIIHLKPVKIVLVLFFNSQLLIRLIQNKTKYCNIKAFHKLAQPVKLFSARMSQVIMVLSLLKISADL